MTVVKRPTDEQYFERMAPSDLNFCTTCGAALDTRQIEGRQRQYCRDCDQPIYRNPKPCAGVLVVDSESVLLIQRTNPPAVGSWSVPAGFLEFDEPPRQAAARELHEETNLSVAPDSLSLAGTTFLEYTPGQFVLVVVYAVSREQTDSEVEAGSDAGNARFWEYESLTSDAPLEPGYRTLCRQVIEDS